MVHYDIMSQVKSKQKHYLKKQDTDLMYNKYDLIQKEYNDCIALLSLSGITLARIPVEKITLDMCFVAVKTTGTALKYVPDNMRTYKISYQAVKQSGMALKFVPEKLILCFPAICEEAVSQNGMALKHVPEELKTNELCLVAINKDVNALEHANVYSKKKVLCSSDTVIDEEAELNVFSGIVLTGKEFNKYFGNRKYYKLTNASEIHNKLKFKDGLNKDINNFDGKKSCVAGGIHFSERNKIDMWRMYDNQKMKYIRGVGIPDDAKVHIGIDTIKADKIILSQKMRL